jgi:hypothetical protein
VERYCGTEGGERRDERKSEGRNSVEQRPESKRCREPRKEKNERRPEMKAKNLDVARHDCHVQAVFPLV